MTDKGNVYDRITAKIVAALEAGTRPWAPSWNAGAMNAPLPRPLRWNGERYNGINVLVLWDAAMRKGYLNRTWLTFKQALELGGHVRKGETGELVVYANKIIRTETNEATGEESQRAIPFLKGYTVFNVEQCEGLPARFYQVEAAPVVTHAPGERVAAVDAFVASTGADLRHGGGRAFYTPTHDFVQMPAFESFHDGQSYAAVLLHEMVHWTKAPARLNRETGRKAWGDEGYAREELVAELGAAFLCADLGVSAEPREDHASYIASWLQVLRNDSRAIFQAASMAQAAADYLHGLQAGETVAEAA